jgi:hypothetical protein
VEGWEGAPNGLAVGLGAPNRFSGVLVFGGGANGLNGDWLGVPNGEEVAVAFGAKGFIGAGDDAAANGSGLGSAGGSANLTCLWFGPPRGVSLPPRPLTIVPF